MSHIYDVEPGEVYWAASDVGWVVGHSYICYAPLLNGNTTIVYEGKPVGTPDAGAFWRVIAEHTVVGNVHGADRVSRHQARRTRRARIVRKYDLSRLPDAVPRRRALRSGHAALGRGTSSACR